MDANGWATEWAKSLQGPRALRIRVDSPEEPLGQALLDTPWELLSGDRGFFADDDAQWFDVARRIGKAGEPAQPTHSDLHVLFMASAVVKLASHFNPLGSGLRRNDERTHAIPPATPTYFASTSG